MDMFALRQAKWDLTARFFRGIGHCNLDPALQFANVLRIGVEPSFIAGTEILLQESQLMRHRIQNARVLLTSRSSFLGARPVTEQAFESDARIHLGRQRLSGRRPRNAIRIRTAITKVATAEVTGIFDPELKGR